MTKHEFHNVCRKLMNIEWTQLPFLSDIQKDNFFANPHMFFIRADDETADKIWEVMFPRGPVAGGIMVDLDKYRKAIQEHDPVVPTKIKWRPKYDHYCPQPACDLEYGTKRVLMFPHRKTDNTHLPT